MSSNKANSLTCPHCQQSTGQLPQEYDITFCVHCENTYIRDEDQEDTSDPVDDAFVLLPPRDHESLPSVSSEELDALSDTETKSTSKTKLRAKPREKKPTTSKRKRTKQNTTTAKVSTKLPSIFSDNILSTVQPGRDDAYSDDELAFSDLSDQEGVNDPHHTPRDQQGYSRKAARQNKGITFSDSDTDDEEEVITVFKKGRAGTRATKESAKSTTIKTAMPLKQYSTFAQFNKEMRSKLAKEYQEAIRESGEPQKHLSRLVADAWKAMPQTEKDEFKQKLKGERALMSSTARKKPSRPSGNGYILYSKTKLPQVKLDYPQSTTARELSAIVSKHWKELDDSEREAYKAKAKQEREDWIKENPELHQQYMDKMTSRIRATKKARRGEKDGA